jgi:hypothetical protein
MKPSVYVYEKAWHVSIPPSDDTNLLDATSQHNTITEKPKVENTSFNLDDELTRMAATQKTHSTKTKAVESHLLSKTHLISVELPPQKTLGCRRHRATTTNTKTTSMAASSGKRAKLLRP